MPAVETFGDLAFGDIFLHLLTGTLALLADEFAVEDFCSGLFDGFLLTAAPRYLGGRTGAGWAGGGGGSACGTCGLFQEGERAASRAAAAPAPAPPRGAGQAAGPAEGAGAHRPGGCPGTHVPVAPRQCGALGVAVGPVLPDHGLSPQSGEAVKELYSQLGERLEQLDQRKPSPAQAAGSPALELPVPAAPAPAGL